MKLKNLIKNIEGVAVTGNADVEVCDIAYSASAVEKGFCFVAMRGEKKDGHDFIPDAISRGAIAIVSERPCDDSAGVANVIVKNSRKALAGMSAAFFGEPSKSMGLVGVTGTSGKTTITYLLEAIFKASGRTPGVIGTVSHRFGGDSQPAMHTTPESYDLQRLFMKMKQMGVDVCAMEVSSHALAQDRVAFCNFDAAVFTNLTPEHLDYHSEMETYFAAKAILFEELIGKSSKPNPFAVINSDDSYGGKLMEKCPVPVVTYGLNSKADISASLLSMNSSGIRMEVKTPSEKFECVSHLCGKFNAMNILAAIAVSMRMGADIGVIRRAIEGLNFVPGRFETVANKRGITAIVDYAHKPDALENVLKEARELAKKTGGNLIVVFGCGGDRDRKKRPVMGELAVKLADRVVVTSDNPRTEDPGAIIDEILIGVKKEKPKDGKCEVIENRREAIGRAVSVSRKGDVIVVAGKGHENYQIIGTKRTHFDDREILKEFLRD